MPGYSLGLGSFAYLKTKNHVKGLLSLSSLLRAVIEPHPITLNQLELEVLDELQF